MTVASELDLLVELLASSVSEQALTFFGGKFTPFRWENRDSWAVGGAPGMLGVSGDVLVVTVGSGACWHLVSRGQACHTLQFLGLQQRLQPGESAKRSCAGTPGQGKGQAL